MSCEVSSVRHDLRLSGQAAYCVMFLCKPFIETPEEKEAAFDSDGHYLCALPLSVIAKAERDVPGNYLEAGDVRRHYSAEDFNYARSMIRDAFTLATPLTCNH